jgi:hypothetical protein
MFENPRPSHQIISLTAMGVGFYMGLNLPNTWPVVMTGGGLIILGVAWGIGNEIGYSADKISRAKSLDIIDRKQDERDVQAKLRAMGEPEQGENFLGLLKIGGKPYKEAVYTQTVAPVKIDHERSMAKLLVAMRDGGFPMNISESYWIREGRWKDGPESFRMTRGKWEYYNIVGKRGSASNSRYEIQNERGVELIASGSLRLPPPPL